MNGPSLFRCPLCGSPLTQEERGCICPARHSFDRAAAGYVHLLPPNRMHSKAPGDDREMVAARAVFLERGYYAPLRQALEELVLEASAHLEGPVLLDSGCGEGYYTAGMFRALERAGLRLDELRPGSWANNAVDADFPQLNTQDVVIATAGSA